MNRLATFFAKKCKFLKKYLVISNFFNIFALLNETTMVYSFIGRMPHCL